MKRLVFLCLFSAAIGAGVATMMTGRPVESSLPAQEGVRFGALPNQLPPQNAAPGPEQIPSFPVVARPVRAPVGEVAHLDDGLLPEERAAVGVYDRVNRSVVNITTIMVRADFLFREVPSEGAGSGSVLDNTGHILTNHHVIDGAKNNSSHTARRQHLRRQTRRARSGERHRGVENRRSG